MIESRMTICASGYARIVRLVKRWIIAGGLALTACAPTAPQPPRLAVTPIPPVPPPAVAPPDQPITLDNADRLAPLARLGTGNIHNLLLSPDGQRLAILASSAMHVYDATQLTPLYTLGNLTRDMTDAAFSPTGEALAVLYTAGSTFASARSAVALLDATNGRELGRFDDSSLAGYGERVALASGGGRFATALFDSGSTGRIVVIDAQSGQVEHSIPIIRPEDSPVTLHFLADSRLLFSAREGITLFDLSSGTTNTLSYPSVPQRVVLSADGERLAVLLVDRSIQIVSLSQGSTTALTTIEAYRNNNQPVRKIALSPAGDQLAVGLAGGVVEIWHLGEPARNDRRLATGMAEWLDIWMGELALGKQALFLAWPDNYIERWNLADVTGAQEVQRLDHLAKYRRAAFGPSADLLALGESSGVVRLWRVSEGRVLKTIGARGPALRTLTGLAFSPDGVLLAMGFETVQPDSFEIEGSISI